MIVRVHLLPLTRGYNLFAVPVTGVVGAVPYLQVNYYLEERFFPTLY